MYLAISIAFCRRIAWDIGTSGQVVGIPQNSSNRAASTSDWPDLRNRSWVSDELHFLHSDVMIVFGEALYILLFSVSRSPALCRNAFFHALVAIWSALFLSTSMVFFLSPGVSASKPAQGSFIFSRRHAKYPPLIPALCLVYQDPEVTSVCVGNSNDFYHAYHCTYRARDIVQMVFYLERASVVFVAGSCGHQYIAVLSHEAFSIFRANRKSRYFGLLPMSH